MSDVERALCRLIRDPRLRAVIVVILVLLAFALAWHLVGMAHHDGMMLGACLAVLAMVGTIALGASPTHPSPPARIGLVRPAPVPHLGAPRTGRPPPQQGTVLRS